MVKVALFYDYIQFNAACKDVLIKSSNKKMKRRKRIRKGKNSMMRNMHDSI